MRYATYNFDIALCRRFDECLGFNQQAEIDHLVHRLKNRFPLARAYSSPDHLLANCLRNEYPRVMKR